MNVCPGSRVLMYSRSEKSPSKPNLSHRPHHGSMHTNGALGDGDQSPTSGLSKSRVIYGDFCVSSSDTRCTCLLARIIASRENVDSVIGSSLSASMSISMSSEPTHPFWAITWETSVSRASVSKNPLPVGTYLKMHCTGVEVCYAPHHRDACFVERVANFKSETARVDG